MWIKFLLISCFGCSSILTTSFDLGGVISGNRMAGVPLGRSLGDGEIDVEGVCLESGVACQNCTRAVTCIPLPVGWLKVPLQECSKKQTCNARKGGCVSDPAPECEAASHNYQHTCEQVGIFPDAFDCRKFHLCSPPQGVPSGSPADHRVALCPRNYGYNPSTAQCSIKLTKGQCTEKPVPGCTKVGDYGVIPSSPSHYYVCLSKRGILYPQIFICPHGWYFWGGFCRPEPQILEKSTTVPAPTTTEEIKITSTSTTETPTTEKLTTETPTTEKSTPRVYFSIHKALFATEKPTTSKPDTFLADKYDNFVGYDIPSARQESISTEEDLFNSWEST